MSDPITRLLEAIEATAQDARDASGRGEVWSSADHPVPAWGEPTPDDVILAGGKPIITLNSEYGGCLIEAHILRNDPSSVLRRCEADRKLIDLHGIVHRNIGWLEWDEGEHAEMYAELPVCGLCVPKHSSFPRREDVPEGPCRTVQLVAEGYGITEEED